MDTVCIRGSFPQEGIREIILHARTFTALFPAGQGADGRMRHSLPRGGTGTRHGERKAPDRRPREVNCPATRGSRREMRAHPSGEPPVDLGRPPPSDTLVARRRSGYIAQSGH